MQQTIEQQIGLLGLKARDRVTNFTGVIECLSFDLYGCVQATLRPQGLDKDGNIHNACWFDLSRLDTSTERVMGVPCFAPTTIEDYAKGPAEKPMR